MLCEPSGRTRGPTSGRGTPVCHLSTSLSFPLSTLGTVSLSWRFLSPSLSYVLLSLELLVYPTFLHLSREDV